MFSHLHILPLGLDEFQDDFAYALGVAEGFGGRVLLVAHALRYGAVQQTAEVGHLLGTLGTKKGQGQTPRSN